MAGTTARVTCQVLTNLKDVNLSWNCVNNGHENKTKTSYTYLSTLSFIVRPFHQNTNCTCTGSFEEFHISSAVRLDVNSKNIEIKNIFTYFDIASLKCIVFSIYVQSPTKGSFGLIYKSHSLVYRS